MTRPGSRGALIAALAAGAGFLVLYGYVLRKLVHDWANDDNYSHGFLIVPLALYFVWERRARLAALPQSGSVAGLVVLLGGVAVLTAGTLGAELFLTRVSLILVLCGAIWFVWGTAYLRALAFPLAFLLLMIPLPAIIFNQIAFPLQLLASRAGAAAVSAAGIPVLREGNVIILPNTTLEVAEACSGIRSLISLLTLGIVFGYFAHRRIALRIAIALATIPIAVLANACRVAGTGIAARYFGAEAAEGFFHTFSGWLIFLVAFALLFAVERVFVRIWPEPPRRDDGQSAGLVLPVRNPS